MSHQHPETDRPSPQQPKASLSDELVEIPSDRRHDSGTGASAPGVLIALVVTMIGAIGLGAGYGALMALCAEKWFNITVAFSIAFWIHLPAQMGFMFGHVRNERCRRPISTLGFAVCIYAICVGWVASVLDGPGLVFDPLRLAAYLADVRTHSFWVDSLGLENDLVPLRPYLLTLRFAELTWVFTAGLMSKGAATPYPYCQECRRWMQDETTIRLKYDPPSTEDARTLASDLVAGEYKPLLTIDQPLEPKEKGLELSVYGCEGNCGHHVLDAIWHRTTPDPTKDEVERMLESRTGTKLVSGLKIPAEIQTHVVNLAKKKAA
jgi:hypothetical protein